MAINGPSYVNTSIETPNYSSPQQEASIQSILTGLKGANDASNEKLKSLLQGKQNKADLATALQAAKDNSGKSVRVGEASVGVDPNAALLKQSKEKQAQGLQQAQKQYQQESKPLTDTLNAVQTGLNALKNDDNTSLGQLRAAMLSSNGFKRFNEPEAMANAPDSVKSQITGLLNKAGLNTPDGSNLTDIQKNNALKFFNGKMDEIQNTHNTAKQNALQMYTQNPYADASQSESLQKSLGSPLDNQIQTVKSGLDALHSKVGSSLPQSQAPQNGGGILSKLAGLFGGGQSTPPSAPNAQPPQSQAAPAGFDPNAYLSGK